MRRIGYVRGGFSFLPAPGPVAMRRAFFFGSREKKRRNPSKEGGTGNPGEEKAEPVKGLIGRLLASAGCSVGQVPVLRCSFSQYRVPGSRFRLCSFSGFPVPPLLFFRVPGSAFALFPGSWFLVPGSAVSSPRLQPQVFGAFAKAFEELGLVDDLHAKRAGLVGLGAWVRAD